MNTIEGLTIRWQPWTVPAALSHVLCSSLAGVVILVLMFAARRASARTRWTMAWIGLVKFLLPLVWFNRTFSRLKPPAMDRWRLLPASLDSSGVGAVSGGITPAPDMAHSVAAAATGNFPAIEVAAFAWAAGAIVLIGIWCWRGHLLRKRLLSAAEPISASLRKRVERAAARVGLAEPPRRVAIAGNIGPGIVGILCPVVVLPPFLEKSLSGEEIDAILIHELTHLRRRDPLWAGLQAVGVRLFWFDPVAWLLDRSLHIETEKSCDETVLDITANGKVYAAGIVKIVRQTLGLKEPGYAGVAGAPVVARVKNILARSAAPHRRQPMVLAMAAAVAVFAFSGFSGAIRAENAASVPTGKVLVVENFGSWKRIPDFAAELDGLGYSSATIKSADMATTDLSQYSLIVLPGAQWQTGFYADYAKAAARFDRFVQNGGTLLLEVNGAEAEGILRQSFHAIPDPPDGGASRVP